MTTARAALPVQVAISLAAGLLQAVCDQVGARAMFVKGPAAVAQGLREPRASSDIDVIIEPVRFEAVVRALTERGWLARFTPADQLRAMSGHSVTLVHADWPCDLDLHHFFVGTFAPPAETFDALVEGSEIHTIAGLPVATPSPIGHRLVLTVNTVRDLGVDRADDEAETLAEHFHANPDDWEQQVILASRTRSLSVLREFARRHDLPDPGSDLGAAELKQLEFVMRYQSQGLGNLRYRLEDPELSLRQKLNVIGRYLYKPSSVIRLENPSFTGGMLATFIANVGRAGKGIRQWRDARPNGVDVGVDTRPAATSDNARELHVRGFRPGLYLAPLPYAELRVEHGSVVIANAASSDTAPTASSGTPLADDPAALLEASTCAVMQDDGTRYVLPVAAAVLARDPRRTPAVLRLDRSGQELLDLVKDGVTTAAAVIDEIARRHALEPAEIGPGITDFLQHLLDAGAITREEHG